MTDLSAMSREEFVDAIEAASTHELYIPLRNEIVSRLRVGADLADRLAKAEPSEESRAWLMTFCQDQGELRAGERVDALVMAFQHLVRERAELRKTSNNQRAELHALNVAIRERDRLTDARIQELEAHIEVFEERFGRIHMPVESQLAANSKGEAFALSPSEQSVVEYVRGSFEGHSPQHTRADVIALLAVVDRATRLPPEPAKPVEPDKPAEPAADGTLHDRIHPTSGRLLHAAPILPDKPATSGDVPEYITDAARALDGLGRHVAADLLREHATADHDKLQRVLAGVERVAAEMERVAAEMERVPLGSGGLQAYVWAAKLRGVIRA